MDGSKSIDIVDQITRLQLLQENGTISVDEFQTLKARLISGEPITIKETGPAISTEPLTKVGTGTRILAIMQKIEALSAIGAVIVCAAFFLYPLLNEGVSGECNAYELKRSHGLFSYEGTLGIQMMKRENPDLPPFIGCTIAYWAWPSVNQ